MALKANKDLTESAAATPKKSLVSFAWLEKLKYAPWGAVSGMVVAGSILWIAPGARPEGWSTEFLFGFFAMIGSLLERVLEPTIFKWFGTSIRHWHAAHDARLALEKLEMHVKEGRVPAREADRIELRIARKDVTVGAGPRPRYPSDSRPRRPPPPAQSS